MPLLLVREQEARVISVMMIRRKRGKCGAGRGNRCPPAKENCDTISMYFLDEQHNLFSSDKFRCRVEPVKTPLSVTVDMKRWSRERSREVERGRERSREVERERERDPIAYTQTSNYNHTPPTVHTHSCNCTHTHTPFPTGRAAPKKCLGTDNRNADTLVDTGPGSACAGVRVALPCCRSYFSCCLSLCCC